MVPHAAWPPRRSAGLESYRSMDDESGPMSNIEFLDIDRALGRLANVSGTTDRKRVRS